MPRRRPTGLFAKRTIDVVVAAFLLFVSAPLSIGTALAVRSSMGRPVLFRQTRAGRNGAPISILKFRTMTNVTDEAGRPRSDAERLTALGHRLRRSSLDELPQLVSVIRGDMSLVGPRPLPMAYVERYDERQRRRLDVRPGLTGWSQVNGRNALPWRERLELDVWYAENRSLGLDLRILVRTVGVVLSGSGVNADGEATMTEFTGER